MQVRFNLRSAVENLAFVVQAKVRLILQHLLSGRGNVGVACKYVWSVMSSWDNNLKSYEVSYVSTV